MMASYMKNVALNYGFKAFKPSNLFEIQLHRYAT